MSTKKEGIKMGKPINLNSGNPGYADAFKAGQNSVLRKNKSGCCCIINDAGEIKSACVAHVEWKKTNNEMAIKFGRWLLLYAEPTWQDNLLIWKYEKKNYNTDVLYKLIAYKL